MIGRLARSFADSVTASDSERLSRELRTGEGEHLDARRRVVGLSLISMGSMALISLFQMGIMRRIPEPPIPGLNAEKVDGSGEAYEKLAMPDAALGLVSYSVTLALAAAGGQERARTAPWLPLMLAAKATIDTAQAAQLSWEQWAKHRAFCSWCLLAAGATFATLPIALPEAREAWKTVRGG